MAGEELKPEKLLEGHTGDVNSVAISPDGEHVVSGSDDETIRIWNVATGKMIHKALSRGGAVYSVSFSHDGHLLVAGVNSGEVQIWDVMTGQLVGEPYRGHKDMVGCAAFSLDNRRIISSSDDKTVRIWDVLETPEMHGLWI